MLGKITDYVLQSLSTIAEAHSTTVVISLKSQSVFFQSPELIQTFKTPRE